VIVSADALPCKRSIIGNGTQRLLAACKPILARFIFELAEIRMVAECFLVGKMSLKLHNSNRTYLVFQLLIKELFIFSDEAM